MPDRLAAELARTSNAPRTSTTTTSCSRIKHSSRPYDASKMRKRFYDALRGAGLGHLVGQDNGITFHSLRHTFGTQMAAAGAPLRDLQEWMGHQNLARTPFGC